MEIKSLKDRSFKNFPTDSNFIITKQYKRMCNNTIQHDCQLIPFDFDN